MPQQIKKTVTKEDTRLQPLHSITMCIHMNIYPHAYKPTHMNMHAYHTHTQNFLKKEITAVRSHSLIEVACDVGRTDKHNIIKVFTILTFLIFL